jgi:hypothetical protein
LSGLIRRQFQLDVTVLPDRVIGPGSVTSFEPKMRGIEVTLQGIIRVWMGNSSWPAVD